MDTLLETRLLKAREGDILEIDGRLITCVPRVSASCKPCIYLSTGDCPRYTIPGHMRSHWALCCCRYADGPRERPILFVPLDNLLGE